MFANPLALADDGVRQLSLDGAGHQKGDVEIFAGHPLRFF